MKTCIVVGAGIDCITAARTLRAAGVHATVLEKSLILGGRLATRRLDSNVFDHGAQFITVRNPWFEELMSEMRHAKVVYEWCRGIGTPRTQAVDDGHPRYQGTGGMFAIPQFLATGLDVRVRQRVVSLRHHRGQWAAHLESGQIFNAGALICTTPVRQALDLLDLGGHDLPDTERDALEQMRYHRCLALMAALDGPSGLPAPGAIRDVDAAVTFLADNQRKGISPGPAVTIHASPAFSREHWATAEPETIRLLLSRAAPHLASRAINASLHRWRYAHPANPYPADMLRIPGPTRLVFAGDAFNGPRVEGAALSGRAAALSLLAG